MVFFSFAFSQEEEEEANLVLVFTLPEKLGVAILISSIIIITELDRLWLPDRLTKQRERGAAALW